MRYRWSFSSLALFGLCLASLRAQPPERPEEGPWIIPLTISAVGETKPALKHRLLPELRDLQQGNQVQAFYKCFFDQNHLFYNKESTDKQDKWMVAPLKTLAAERELINYGSIMFGQARYASRLDTVDWALTNQIRSEGVFLLLPDLQQMRMLAAVLKVRVRGEIARGEFDNAVRTLQIMFSLGRMFNDHPTLLGHLVGIAITGIALGVVEEMIQQPNAPNMFWPLANLPNPFIDLRRGSQGEKLFLTREHEVLRKSAPIPEAELKALIKRYDEMLQFETMGARASEWYPKEAADTPKVAAARDRLVNYGFKRADLEKLSGLQIVMMDDYAQYEIGLDDFIKWIGFPYWQIPVEPKQKKDHGGPLGGMLPMWSKVILARARTQQNIALLMTTEAIRAHAAANAGKLPATLGEIKLPVPVDAFSGKPFSYEVKNGKGILRGHPPEEHAKNPANNRVFEITIRP